MPNISLRNIPPTVLYKKDAFVLDERSRPMKDNNAFNAVKNAKLAQLKLDTVQPLMAWTNHKTTPTAMANRMSFTK